MDSSAFYSFSYAFAKLQFTSVKRIEFYETVALLLENNVQLNDALLELYEVWSDKGKKPGEPLPMVARACAEALGNGVPISEALLNWVPDQEASMVAAGDRAGTLISTFADVVKLIEYKQRIGAAVKKALIYPFFLVGMLVVLLYQVSVKLVPQMARTSSPEEWEGAMYLLYMLSQFVTHAGIYFLLVIFLLLTGVFYSLPRLTGKIRVYLDHLPIYRTFRVMHGATFLLNVSVMMRSGMQQKEALKLLAQNANEWLYERINGAIYGLDHGVNLGVSLERAEHNFPDKRSVQMISILAERKGFEQAMMRFSERWLEQTIFKIERGAVITLYSSIFSVFLVMGLVVLATQDMQNAIEANVSSAQN